MSRVILHIDLDCFYVQVERSLDRNLANQCVGVVQYNPLGDVKTVGPHDNRVLSSLNGFGGLIAVSYEARAKGVNRHMRAAEAKAQCPELILVQVPVTRGKPDLSAYRQAGDAVVAVIQQHVGSCPIERASIDEVYVDITAACSQCMSNASAVSDMTSWSDVRVAGAADDDTATQWLAAQNTDCCSKDAIMLNLGAQIAHEVRQSIFSQLHFTCSGGIAHNKLLAKIASSMHKPNIQTIVPPCFLPQLLSSLPLRKLRGLGGKLGDILSDEMGLKMATDIAVVGIDVLTSRFGQQQAEYLLQLSRGESSEEVTHRLAPSNITCSKQFNGRAALPLEISLRRGDIDTWLQRLSEEMLERVGNNGATWLSAAINIFTKNSAAKISNSNNGTTDDYEKTRLSKRIEFPVIDDSNRAVEIVSAAAIRLVKECLANPNHKNKHHQYISDMSLLSEYRYKQSTLLSNVTTTTSTSVWYISSISVQAQGVGGAEQDKDSHSCDDTPDIRSFFATGAAMNSTSSANASFAIDGSPSIKTKSLVGDNIADASSCAKSNLKIPEGVDADVFLSLPPEIQREIFIDAENKRVLARFNENSSSKHASQARKKPRGIETYFVTSK